jgi:hypothetical protein
MLDGGKSTTREAASIPAVPVEPRLSQGRNTLFGGPLLRERPPGANVSSRRVAADHPVGVSGSHDEAVEATTQFGAYLVGRTPTAEPSQRESTARKGSLGGDGELVGKDREEGEPAKQGSQESHAIGSHNRQTETAIRERAHEEP